MIDRSLRGDGKSGAEPFANYCENPIVRFSTRARENETRRTNGPTRTLLAAFLFADVFDSSDRRRSIKGGQVQSPWIDHDWKPQPRSGKICAVLVIKVAKLDRDRSPSSIFLIRITLKSQLFKASLLKIDLLNNSVNIESWKLDRGQF